VFDAPEHPEDFVRLVRARRLNGIVLCGDVSKRLYLTRKTGEEGLPAMVEMPISSDIDTAGSLFEERLQRGPNPALLAIAPWRFAPDLQLARGILQGGMLGESGTFEIALPADPLPLPEASSADAPVAAAELIQNHGWQAMELVRHLFGDVASLRAARLRSATGASERVGILVRCTGEWSGRVCIGPPGRVSNQWITLKGSEDSIELNRDDSYFINHEDERTRLGGTGCFGIETWQRLANAFADVVAKRTPTWMSEAELLRTVELVQAALMSLGAGLAWKDRGATGAL